MNSKIKNNLLTKLQGKVAIGFDVVDEGYDEHDEGYNDDSNTIFFIVHPVFGDNYYQLDLYGGVLGGRLSNLGEHELKKLVKGILLPEANLVEILENWDGSPFKYSQVKHNGAKSGSALVSILRNNNNFPELFIISQEARLREEAAHGTPKTPTKPKV